MSCDAQTLVNLAATDRLASLSHHGLAEAQAAQAAQHTTFPAPAAPGAIAATNILGTSFSANWNSSATATGYRLDVSSDPAFGSFVPGFNNLDVGNVLTYSVTGLSGSTGYHYRLRAYNGGGASASSNVITAVTSPASGVNWIPASAAVTWTDTNGTFTGNLATFTASANLATVTSITALNLALTSLTGLGFVPSLSFLDCSQNLLASLDVSGNPALNTLDCHDNSLTTLDVSACTALNTLDCVSNSLTTLNVSNNPALQTFDCDTNFLTVLDVSSCGASLVGLTCYSNSLTTLDISNNASINVLDASINNLTQAAVNGILVSLDSFGTMIGTVSTQGQTPAAPPSGAGVVAAASLTVKNWTVTTD